MGKNTFFVTTPIYYVNDLPHIGHAYTSIACDVIARFNRLNGKKTMFLTGTDEHGQKIEQAAKKKDMDTKKFVDEMSLDFKKLTKLLNLSNDSFIRTTDSFHKKASQHIWNILKKNNQIYLGKYKGWYSVSDEAYFNDDEIVTDEKTKKKLAPSGNEVQWVEEESYFFKLSKWQDRLLQFYEKNPDFIGPGSRKNEVVSFVKKGLNDLSISRTTFSWGVEVPDDKKHVMYVWLDALINYLSAIGYPDNKYKKFWPADVHIVGKDIIRFHAIYWPAFLLAANIPPPQRVFGHGWILSGDEKMSKSKGNILNPLEIIDTYGIDQLRYYLIKEVSHGTDGNISLKNLENCINSDLANNYGNLCQRVFSFIKNNCANKVNKTKNITDADKKLLNETKSLIKDLRNDMNNQNLNNYMKSVINISFLTNKYINDEEPWKLKKNNVEKMNNILHISLEQIAKISILLNPIIPEATTKVLDSLNVKSEFLNYIIWPFQYRFALL